MDPLNRRQSIPTHAMARRPSVGNNLSQDTLRQKILRRASVNVSMEYGRESDKSSELIELVEKQQILNAARKLDKLPEITSSGGPPKMCLNVASGAKPRTVNSSLVPVNTMTVNSSHKKSIFDDTGINRKVTKRLSITKLPAPNTFPKAIIYPKSNNPDLVDTLHPVKSMIPQRRASLLANANIFKTPAPAPKRPQIGPVPPKDGLNNQKYVKVTCSESNNKYEVVQSRPKYVLKSPLVSKPSTSTAPISTTGLQSIQETKAVKYVIPQNLVAAKQLGKIATNLNMKQSFRPYVVPAQKKQFKMTEDLFVIEDSTKMTDKEYDGTEVQSPTSSARNRRKSILVPNSVDTMQVEFEEPYTPPARPKANISMMKQLSLLRSVARGLLDKIAVRQMDFNDSDHINMYKFYR